MFEDMPKITTFFKSPSTSMTHTTDNDDISPENAKPLNKKVSKSGSREDTAFLKTVLHWKKDFTIDLGYKLSKLLFEKGRKLQSLFLIFKVSIFDFAVSQT